jgi:MFS superfamily sulfate permease-like transporter
VVKEKAPLDTVSTEDLIMEIKRRNHMDRALSFATKQDLKATIDGNHDVNDFVDDDKLVELVDKRQDVHQYVAGVLPTDLLCEQVQDRGCKLLIDARADDLERELRRLLAHDRPGVEEYYHEAKEPGKSHVTDEPLFDVYGPVEELKTYTRYPKRARTSSMDEN